jgi:hypothetical protein
MYGTMTHITTKKKYTDLVEEQTTVKNNGFELKYFFTYPINPLEYDVRHIYVYIEEGCARKYTFVTFLDCGQLGCDAL